MDKISTTIFQSQSNDEELTTANIFSESHSHCNFNSNNEINFKTIAMLREMKLANTLRIYTKYYNACVATINNAINRGKTDILFKIPINCIDKNYNVNDCIEFICNKLNQYDICTTKLNNQTIFITWINIQV